ncbi:trypsin-like peptidase domain-containing protein [Thermodesulfobacteriota bacterium]
MKLISHIALLLIILSLISRISFLSHAETYKWTDEEGVVHFSDRLTDINNSSYEIIPDNKQGDTNRKKPVKSVAPPPELNKNPIEYATDCTFTVKGKKNIGTGFFISPNGYAITCKHVIENGPSHTAVLNNNEEYPIGVISISSEYDIALILVTTIKKTPFLKFRDPFTLKPGEKVYAVGSSIGLQSTVTDGLFSGQRKKMATEQRTIQFSAPVNPGNSGGPLIDKDGKVIGAISWKLLSNKGIPVTGIGFAVPSDYILKEYRGYMD